MASSPPVKCLRGIVRVSPAGASAISSSLDVPVAIGLYPSNIGIKPEIWYQRSNGDWIEVSRAGSGVPGISEHPMTLISSDADAEAAVINQIGVKMWTVQKLQQWANDNLYAFFKPLVSAPATGGVTGGPVTGGTLMAAVNDALAEMFVLVDTNADGIPEFHGK